MSRPCVLHVEDNRTQLVLVDEILKSRGYDVLSAEDFDSAMSAVRSKRPDVILLDIMMPGVNGIDACARFKADARLKDVPVIMLTALYRSADMDRAYAAGAADYVSKPVNIEGLELKIKKFLPKDP